MSKHILILKLPMTHYLFDNYIKVASNHSSSETDQNRIVWVNSKLASSSQRDIFDWANAGNKIKKVPQMSCFI